MIDSNVHMNEGGRLLKVVVCAPETEYFNAIDPSVHNIEQYADKDAAIAQHRQLCKAMSDNGVEVLYIQELKNHPNSVFPRDTCVRVSHGYIQLRMGLSSRQGEELWMAEFLEQHGMYKFGAIHSPGTVEGGDVILAGNVVFIGQSRRSNAEGVKQIKKLFEKGSFEVRIAEVPPPRLHIGGMMSMIGPRRVLCCLELFPEGFFQGFDVISVSAESFISGNVICLDENVVIAEKSNVPAIHSLQEKEVRVYDLDLSEFVKGRGGPTCLIMPLERCSD